MTFNLQSHRKSLLAGILIPLMLSACGGPKMIAIHGESTAGLNRDAQGKPLSVVVHIYQLRSAEAFNRMTMDALLAGKTEQDLLGNTLISSKELTMIPGKSVTDSETIGEETRYVGVVGFFRRPDPGYWRLLFDADAIKSRGLVFKAADCFLQPVTAKNIAIPGQSSQPPAECTSKLR